jgi:hypothetical protein
MNFAFSRPQNVLRSFFGLGPQQLGFNGQASPVVDITHLLPSTQDQEQFSAVSAVTAPGAAGTAVLNLPRVGYWLIDWVHLESGGPATSGSIDAWPYFTMNRGGLVNIMGISDHVIVWTKSASTFRLGWRFEKPVVLVFPRTGVADSIQCNFANIAGSVGNASMNISALARQLELS